jgi:hypothetical protein
MSETKVFKFSDDTIGQIAKILQMAILTGTDVVDNLRMFEVYEDNGSLFPSDDYASKFEGNVEKLLEEALEFNNDE